MNNDHIQNNYDNNNNNNSNNNNNNDNNNNNNKNEEEADKGIRKTKGDVKKKCRTIDQLQQYLHNREKNILGKIVELIKKENLPNP